MLHGSTNRFEPCELDQNIPPERVGVLYVCIFLMCECHALKHLCERKCMLCVYGITSSQTGQTPRCDRGASSTARALSLIVASDAVACFAALAGVDLRAETGESLPFVLARCDRGDSSTFASDTVDCLAALVGVDLRAETGDSLSFVLAVRHASW
jgi:hypothetical protein